MAFLLGFRTALVDADNSAKCFLACAKTFGWKTCFANSSLVIFDGCFFLATAVIL